MTVSKTCTTTPSQHHSWESCFLATVTVVSISTHLSADFLPSHRLCKNVFDRDYKATIGVDFEIERFEIAGIPYSLQM